MLAVVATQHRSVAVHLGIKAKPSHMNDTKAQLTMRLASAGCVKGNGPLRLAQCRAACTTAHAIISEQARHFQQRLADPLGDDTLEHEFGKSRIHVVEWGCIAWIPCPPQPNVAKPTEFSVDRTYYVFLHRPWHSKSRLSVARYLIAHLWQYGHVL